MFSVVGILGSAITYGLNPTEKRSPLGNVALGKGYSVSQGFFVEFILTGILVFAFLASTSDDNYRKDFGFANALAVGLAITLAQLVGVCIDDINFNFSCICSKAVKYYIISVSMLQL